MVSTRYVDKVIPTEGMKRYECTYCGKLLFLGKLPPGSVIETVCYRCSRPGHKEKISFAVM